MNANNDVMKIKIYISLLVERDTNSQSSTIRYVGIIMLKWTHNIIQIHHNVLWD